MRAYSTVSSGERNTIGSPRERKMLGPPSSRIIPYRVARSDTEANYTTPRPAASRRRRRSRYRYNCESPGDVAKWQGSGLQNRDHRFESGRRLPRTFEYKTRTTVLARPASIPRIDSQLTA